LFPSHHTHDVKFFNDRKLISFHLGEAEFHSVINQEENLMFLKNIFESEPAAGSAEMGDEAEAEPRDHKAQQ
jgi:hypothetical protein